VTASVADIHSATVVGYFTHGGFSVLKWSIIACHFVQLFINGVYPFCYEKPGNYACCFLIVRNISAMVSLIHILLHTDHFP
jgi:hypothetical protein